MKKIVILLAALFLIAGIWWQRSAPSPSANMQEVVIDPSLRTIVLTGPERQLSIAVELADTPEERAHGLMERTALANGMLFIFDIPAVQTFWMKNTLIPLDIAFFDADGLFISSTRMEPCTESPCAVYSSGAPALYALEMPAGFLKQMGVDRGWKMKIL